MGSSQLFKKLTNKVVGILALLFVLIAVLVTYLYMTSIIENQTVYIIICTISIIGMMMMINTLTTRFVAKKFANKNSNPKYYSIDSIDSFKEILIANKASVTTYDFGKNYLLINGSNAFRICIVDNNDLYFNRETNEKSKSDKRLEKCTKFCGFEIFKNINDEILPKVELFTFQSENVCYTGFYLNKETNQLVQANYEEIKDCHKENFNYILELLNINPIINEEVS